MIVGPMRKRMLNTFLIGFIIPILIFGIAGYFIISNYSNRVKELEAKIESDVIEVYVFKEDMHVNDTIKEDDIMKVFAKSEAIPGDAIRYIKKGNNVTDDKYMAIGKVLRTNVTKGTALSEAMFFEDNTELTLDQRLQEFNMILLPSNLNLYDYIDVRLLMPTGEDYVVLASKRVEKMNENTVWLKVSEEEILNMGSALVESYIIQGSKLYAVAYTEPYAQLEGYLTLNIVDEYRGVLNNLLNPIKAQKREEILPGIQERVTTELGAEATPEAINERVESLVNADLAMIDRNAVPIGSLGVALQVRLDALGQKVEVNPDVIKQIEQVVDYNNAMAKIRTEVTDKNKGKNAREIEEAIQIAQADDDAVIALIDSIQGEEDKKSALASILENKHKYEEHVYQVSITYNTTYPVSEKVKKLIENNPNLVQEVWAQYNTEAYLNRMLAKELNTDVIVRYDEEGKEIVYYDNMGNVIKQSADKNISNLKEKLQVEIETQRQQRIEYLQELLDSNS